MNVIDKMSQSTRTIFIIVFVLLVIGFLLAVTVPLASKNRCCELVSGTSTGTCVTPNFDTQTCSMSGDMCVYPNANQCENNFTNDCYFCNVLGLAYTIHNNNQKSVGDAPDWSNYIITYPDGTHDMRNVPVYRKFYNSPTYDTFISYATTPTSLIFSVQGTKFSSMENIKLDLENFTMSLKAVMENYHEWGYAGMGWVTAADDMWDNLVKGKLDSKPNCVYDNHQYPCGRVIFVGHSLGSAVAGLLALRAAKTYPSMTVEYVGLATPPIGDSGLAKTVYDTPNLSARLVIAKDDPIGTMKPDAYGYTGWGYPWLWARESLSAMFIGDGTPRPLKESDLDNFNILYAATHIGDHKLHNYTSILHSQYSDALCNTCNFPHCEKMTLGTSQFLCDYGKKCNNATSCDPSNICFQDLVMKMVCRSSKNDRKRASYRSNCLHYKNECPPSIRDEMYPKSCETCGSGESIGTMGECEGLCVDSSGKCKQPPIQPQGGIHMCSQPYSHFTELK